MKESHSIESLKAKISLEYENFNEEEFEDFFNNLIKENIIKKI